MLWEGKIYVNGREYEGYISAEQDNDEEIRADKRVKVYINDYLVFYGRISEIAEIDTADIDNGESYFVIDNGIANEVEEQSYEDLIKTAVEKEIRRWSEVVVKGVGDKREAEVVILDVKIKVYCDKEVVKMNTEWGKKWEIKHKGNRSEALEKLVEKVYLDLVGGEE